MRKRKSRVQKFNEENRCYDIERAKELRYEKRQKYVDDRRRENPLKEKETYDKNGRRKKHIGRLSLLKTVIMLLIITVIGVSAKTIIDLKIEKKHLESKQQALKIEKQNLEAELDNIDNLDYIEEQARIQLKLIKPGETLFVVEDKNNDENYNEDDK